MAELSESDVRAVLENVLKQQKTSYRWVTGVVGLVTRSGAIIEGRLERLEDWGAVVAIAEGERHIAFRDIESVQVRMRSPGPE
jgi:hypothetical protein